MKNVMSLSLFDLVGPIMMGPSSSHTAGAVRIGYMARQIIGQEPQKITLYFQHVLMQTYTGHRTHGGLVAGLLGLREDDAEGVRALGQIKDKGISLEIRQLENSEAHQNTMRILADTNGKKYMINGISIGGGSIRISEIDGLEVDLDGNNFYLLVRTETGCTLDLDALLQPFQILDLRKSALLSCWTTNKEVTAGVLQHIGKMSGVNSIQLIKPLYPYRDFKANTPLFTTVSEYLAAAEKLGLSGAALTYETQRTGKSPIEVKEMFAEILDVMEEAMKQGLEGNAQLVGGFCPGNDGRRLMNAFHEGRSITGGILVPAMARGLSIMEVNGAMGRIVATPTAGSAATRRLVLMPAH